MIPVVLPVLKMFSTLRGLETTWPPNHQEHDEIRTQNNLHFQGTDCNLIIFCLFHYWFYDCGQTWLKFWDFSQVMYSASYQIRKQGLGILSSSTKSHDISEICEIMWPGESAGWIAFSDRIVITIEVGSSISLAHDLCKVSRLLTPSIQPEIRSADAFVNCGKANVTSGSNKDADLGMGLLTFHNC